MVYTVCVVPCERTLTRIFFNRVLLVRVWKYTSMPIYLISLINVLVLNEYSKRSKENIGFIRPIGLISHVYTYYL